MGIKNLQIQSKALSMRWLWKYSNNNQLLWRKVIGAKHVEEDNWITREVTTPYGVCLWRSVRSLWNEVKNNSKIKVLDGRKTRFWKDNWHESGNMEILFPDIYNLVLRHLNDWEIMRVAEFFNSVDTFNGLQTCEDVLWWTGDGREVFKVNKVYKMMDQTNQSGTNGLGNKYGGEAVLTQDNVMKRGYPCAPDVSYVVKQMRLSTIYFYIAGTPTIVENFYQPERHSLDHT
ncbi:hypothetical protein H5410_041632 [Solanum commersonii]|uniref:Uncharacterized protein n=1 Tax=Solanum commersonii TaxID=4109 RepID=A0A9J5XW26_SOLCO|nr:hypothetical protein H5410_041632 [Solanum commersonii]